MGGNWIEIPSHINLFHLLLQKKELVNYIELEKDDYTCSVFGNVFTKEIIKFKIIIRERGEIPIHNHQI